MMLVLGIESSCDETGLALYSDEGLLAHALYSQIDTHKLFGGVVPELASRDHIKYLVPLFDEVLKEAKIELKDIDAVAYTAGPGLVGALLTGATFAKSLAYALGIPSIAIHHLEAHILAAKLDDPQLEFPFVALLVSGGHTQLIEARELGAYSILGDTLDDAVGEAFDKTAKLMGISYPGGAMLAKLADSWQGDYAHKWYPASFPRPMLDRPGLNFSFSGLKTHALNVWQKSAQDDNARAAIAHAFQQAVIETLSVKCQRALSQTKISRLVVAGGVGANLFLRKVLHESMSNSNATVYFPKMQFCTDNGAMIAYAGYLYMKQNKKDSGLDIQVKSRWPLTSNL